LSAPSGLVAAANGDVFIADTNNSRIRELAAIALDAVTNAASGAASSAAAGEYITLYGFGLGPEAPAQSQWMQQGLGGTRVFCNGIEAYLTYTSSGQVNLVAPNALASSGSALFSVQYGGGQVSLSVPLAPSVPGIFTQAYGGGQAWLVNQDQTFNSAANPAPRGTVVAFWATGQGATSPASVDGQAPSAPFPSPVLPVGITVGGVPVAAGDILFDALMYVGVMQMNFRIPAAAPSGSSVPLVLTIGNAASRSDVTIAVQ
jgi:uncharacterized protein (TIGR03437 family)